MTSRMRPIHNDYEHQEIYALEMVSLVQYIHSS